MALKKTAIGIILIFIITGIYFVKFRPRRVHFHAAFHVYQDDVLRDFSRDEFMHFAPCGEEKKRLPDHKIDLHDHIGDVVHVHRSDAKWKDLLDELKIDTSGSIKYYLNGLETSNLPERKIANLDQVLVLINSATNIQTKLQNLPEIQKIEGQAVASETCSD